LKNLEKNLLNKFLVESEMKKTKNSGNPGEISNEFSKIKTILIF